MEDCCPVCLDDLCHGTALKLDCGHSFHNTCLNQILDHAKSLCLEKSSIMALKHGRPFHKKSYQQSMFVAPDHTLKCPLCRTLHTIYNDTGRIIHHPDTGELQYSSPLKRWLGYVCFKESFKDELSTMYHHITGLGDMAHYFHKEQYVLFKTGRIHDLDMYSQYLVRMYKIFLERTIEHPAERRCLPAHEREHRCLHVVKCSCTLQNPTLEERNCCRYVHHGTKCTGIILFPEYMCPVCNGDVRASMHATIEEVRLSLLGFLQSCVG